MGARFKLEKFKAGEPLEDQLTATRLNAMLDAIEEGRIEFGPNINGTRTPSGTILRGQARSQGGGSATFPFQLTLTSQTGEEDPDHPMFGVAIKDGQINGQFPTGMGFDNYVINASAADLADLNVYAVVTLDPNTMEILSRDLGVCASPDFPSNTITAELITFNFFIGYTYLVDDVPILVNSLVGDINFTVVAGSLNGRAAIIPIMNYCDWLAYPE